MVWRDLHPPVNYEKLTSDVFVKRGRTSLIPWMEPNLSQIGIRGNVCVPMWVQGWEKGIDIYPGLSLSKSVRPGNTRPDKENTREYFRTSTTGRSIPQRVRDIPAGDKTSDYLRGEGNQSGRYR
jgi:hypothetical protein